ncbi:putative toxin-antitoxin system toxin component, PIN family [Pleomorphovibrio marinus]|uniref:putative toxin-antitoxin system toxin component, PIN family n=1 Tax=Pleomorphovibrio marinus TaxID=2164132 RepID=UPI000E0A620C|nr:putative toxin-antitoxin system toxin component, PIN family [Pleomorphovibrio marinus]
MVFVFDTSALISAHLIKNSVSAEALNRALRIGKLVFSDSTINEFAEVLYRKKLDRYFVEVEREEILTVLTFKSPLIIEPSFEINVCRDPKDNKFLELAVSAKASCIVSGDIHLLELHPFQGIPILNVADFQKDF